MPWSAGQFVGVAVGALMVAAGLWLIATRRFGRAGGEEDEEGGPRAGKRPELAGARAWWARRSEPTKRVVELCLIVAGYHVAVYSLPRGMAALAVPREMWWVVAAGVVAAVGMSLWIDRMQRER